MGSINSEVEEELDQADVLSLTHNVRSFSEALQGLKQAIAVNEGNACLFRLLEYCSVVTVGLAL